MIVLGRKPGGSGGGGGAPSGPAGGDLGGTYPNPDVGTVDNDVLGSGTPGATNFLRGDRTWVVPPGAELSYVEFTANVTVNATVEASANTVATAASITLDGATSVIVECFTPAQIVNASAQIVHTLWDGATDLGRIGQGVTPTAAGMWNPTVIRRRLTNPSNGSHQYIWKAWRVAGDCTVAAGAGGTGVFMPGYIRVTKV